MKNLGLVPCKWHAGLRILVAVCVSVCSQAQSRPLEGRRENIELDYLSARELVKRLYIGILFREPDPEGLNFHSQYVVGNGYEGLIQRAGRIARSAEFKLTIAPAFPAETIANNLYQTFFRRPLDAGTPWPSMIQNGKASDASISIVGSDEFFNRNVLPLVPGGTVSRGRNFTEIVTGGFHTCGLDQAGVHCWGDNRHSQSSVPPDLVGVKHLAAGYSHTCAIAASGVRCWGDNFYGQTTVLPNLVGVREIIAGGNHNCVIDMEGVKCWGNNAYGQTNVPSNLFGARELAAGMDHTCALDDEGIKCWGSNEFGQSTVPTNSINIRKITAGYIHTCLLNDSGVACWGDNRFEQATIPPNLAAVSSVWAGGGHTCALGGEKLVCWGNNRYGQTVVPESLPSVKQFCGGIYHNCAVTQNETVCWGSNGFGQSQGVKTPV